MNSCLTPFLNLINPTEGLGEATGADRLRPEGSHMRCKLRTAGQIRLYAMVRTAPKGDMVGSLGRQSVSIRFPNGERQPSKVLGDRAE